VIEAVPKPFANEEDRSDTMVVKADFQLFGRQTTDFRIEGNRGNDGCSRLGKFNQIVQNTHLSKEAQPDPRFGIGIFQSKNEDIFIDLKSGDFSLDPPDGFDQIDQEPSRWKRLGHDFFTRVIEVCSQSRELPSAGFPGGHAVPQVRNPSVVKRDDLGEEIRVNCHDDGGFTVILAETPGFVNPARV